MKKFQIVFNSVCIVWNILCLYKAISNDVGLFATVHVALLALHIYFLFSWIED